MSSQEDSIPAGRTQKLPTDFLLSTNGITGTGSRAFSAFAAAESHTGFVRDANEDSYGYCATSATEPALFAVADGIGGHGNGNYASRLLIRMLLVFWRDYVKTIPADRKKITKELDQAIRTFDSRIYELNDAAENTVPMGTTLAMVIVMPDFSITIHLGDSRVYVLRRNNKLEQLTTDHSYIAELLRKKQITPEQAASHPLAHVILRSIGPAPDANPEIQFHERQPGDRYLVCSDGVTNHLNNLRIKDILSRAKHPAEAVHSLINNSLREGGTDNITAVCAFF